MSELKTNLEQILQEKETKIIPENIKKDVQIFDVTGTLETGIDTSSDNPITTNDVVQGKEGFVNGEKITGTLIDRRNSEVVEINTVSNIQVDVAGTIMIISTKQFANIVADSSTKFNVNIEMSQMAEAIGLTADKIKSGETILGITGTYTGDEEAPVPPEEETPPDIE